MTTLQIARRSPLLALCGLLCAFAPLLALATPTNFKVVPDAQRNTVTMTWTSGAPQIRFDIQKLLPTGVWTSLSGFPVNHINTGKFFFDTPTTTTGTFRFRIRAKKDSAYSPWTDPWVVLNNLH